MLRLVDGGERVIRFLWSNYLNIELFHLFGRLGRVLFRFENGGGVRVR